jgi:N-acyl homoserine lactone hydrolase
MKVEMLSGGWFSSPAGVWRQGDEMERWVRFPVPAYLIECAEHRVLVDTGLNPDAVRDPARHYGSAETMALFKLEVDVAVADQVDPSSITAVVLTHLHFDHAGGASRLPPTVPIFVQRREWEAAHDEEAMARNFLFPVDYESISDQVELIDGDHDLLGDGTVRLLSTPGHTPGHQSVQVGERLVIGGDVGHYKSTLDDLRFPRFADDHEAQRASATRLRALRETGTTITPGHDPAVLEPGPVDPGV